MFDYQILSFRPHLVRNDAGSAKIATPVDGMRGESVSHYSKGISVRCKRQNESNFVLTLGTSTLIQ
jgi:hypothetical protein